MAWSLISKARDPAEVVNISATSRGSRAGPSAAAVDRSAPRWCHRRSYCECGRPHLGPRQGPVLKKLWASGLEPPLEMQMQLLPTGCADSAHERFDGDPSTYNKDGTRSWRSAAADSELGDLLFQTLALDPHEPGEEPEDSSPATRSCLRLHPQLHGAEEAGGSTTPPGREVRGAPSHASDLEGKPNGS